ncbi:prepilin peptidase [Enterobacter asburiae]|uniref:prepilin peptidase n=1 Tax=Enterobacter asburiae TaxID=61645 RepID=UPI003F542D97
MTNLLLLALPVACVLVARQMTGLARTFLLAHRGPALPPSLQGGITLLFTLLVCALWLPYFIAGTSLAGTLRNSLLLAWGIPLVTLDVLCYWLPLCFTTGFWLSGLLLTQLPGSPVTLLSSLVGSAGTFVALRGLRAVANHYGSEERVGLGDVHLIAGLAAWYGWERASLLSAVAFLLLSVSALVSRQHTLPYAPWLFALLAGVTMGCPQLLTGNIYAVIHTFSR